MYILRIDFGPTASYNEFTELKTAMMIYRNARLVISKELYYFDGHDEWLIARS